MAVISRPTAKPCTTRAAISCHISPAALASTRPATNSGRPASSGSRGPRASERMPEATMPTMLATRNPVNAQP